MLTNSRFRSPSQSAAHEARQRAGSIWWFCRSPRVISIGEHRWWCCQTKERLSLQNWKKLPFLTASGIFNKYNVDSSALWWALVPEGHYSEFNFEKKVMLTHCNYILWMLSKVAEMRSLVYKVKVRESGLMLWNSGVQQTPLFSWRAAKPSRTVLGTQLFMV